MGMMSQTFALALEERVHGAIRRWHLVLSARSLEQAFDMLLFAFKMSNIIEGFNYYRYLGTCQAVSQFRRDHVQNLLLGTQLNASSALPPKFNDPHKRQKNRSLNSQGRCSPSRRGHVPLLQPLSAMSRSSGAGRSLNSSGRYSPPSPSQTMPTAVQMEVTARRPARASA